MIVICLFTNIGLTGGSLTSTSRMAGNISSTARTYLALCLAVLNTTALDSRGLVALAGTVLSIPDTFASFKGPAATTQYDLISLADAFSAELAECFHSSTEFRNDLISCAPDVGLLFSRGTPTADGAPDYDEEGCRRRLGHMLELHLGHAAPTADEFVGSFSALCGEHFQGFESRFLPRADTAGAYRQAVAQCPGALEWHQDWAAADLEDMFGASRTVMFAFPAVGSSDHQGTGIFTELVQLTHEFSTESLKTTTSSYHGLATDAQDRKAARDLGVSDDHIVRPHFGRGQEILRYKDSEHLHRSPRSTSDPAGRARQAIWRFQ
jgi:hypothetical protein